MWSWITVNLNQSPLSTKSLMWKSLNWKMDIINLYIISLHRAGYGVSTCFLIPKSPSGTMVDRKLRGGLSTKSVSPNNGKKTFLCNALLSGETRAGSESQLHNVLALCPCISDLTSLCCKSCLRWGWNCLFYWIVSIRGIPYKVISHVWHITSTPYSIYHYCIFAFCVF